MHAQCPDPPMPHFNFRALAWFVILVLAGINATAFADVEIPMKRVTADGIGKPVGKVVVSESAFDLVFTPALAGLEPGLHGFHLDEKPDCSAAPKDGKPSAAEAAENGFSQ